MRSTGAASAAANTPTVQLPRLRIRRVSHYPALVWLLSGGFRGPQLGSHFFLPLVRAIERRLALVPGISASRIRIDPK